MKELKNILQYLKEDKKTNSVEEPIRSKHSKESLNSDLLEHCQQFNECEFLSDWLINEDESINFNCVNNESDSSCSSIEYYLSKDDSERNSNDNNTAEFSISNSCNVLTNSVNTNLNLASNLAQWAVEYRISHTALNSLLCILKKYNFFWIYWC